MIRIESMMSGKTQSVTEASDSKELLCEHKGSSESCFALGLREKCYEEFAKLSGGLDGEGMNPPAFQQAEKERLAKSVAKDNATESADVVNSSSGFCRDKNGVGANSDHIPSDNYDGTSVNDSEGSENLSDIDDLEVEGYIHNDEEKHYKKIIWEKLNRDYLQDQALKEAAKAAEGAAFEANFRGCPEELQKARELAASAAQALLTSRKEKRQERLRYAKNATPAQTAAEAAQQILVKKRLSSKVNYDVLEKLFEESGTKKMKPGSDSDNNGTDETKKHETESTIGGDDSELADVADEWDRGDAYGTVSYDDNGDVISYDDEDYGYEDYY